MQEMRSESGDRERGPEHEPINRDICGYADGECDNGEGPQIPGVSEAEACAKDQASMRSAKWYGA